MKIFLPILISTVLFMSCYRNILTDGNSVVENKKWQLKISSSNLSEDATTLSTQNDELIILVYSKLESAVPTLIAQEYFVHSDISESKMVSLNTKKLLDEKLFIVLIELDSKQSLAQIEPIVRINLQKLSDNFYDEDKSPTRELLGDDDLLGIEKYLLKS